MNRAAKIRQRLREKFPDQPRDRHLEERKLNEEVARRKQILMGKAKGESDAKDNVPAEHRKELLGKKEGLSQAAKVALEKEEEVKEVVKKASSRGSKKADSEDK